MSTLNKPEIYDLILGFNDQLCNSLWELLERTKDPKEAAQSYHFILNKMKKQERKLNDDLEKYKTDQFREAFWNEYIKLNKKENKNE